ncbi:hypothetical protein [Nocardia gipuzkoensis]|uniref:hypothetical protein n=1 Tax=Nocardia gipuzkoensis TaxID=2749991 RepID=UPI00237D37C3|nr:hypothetical protein [Nocardia gipuzkoensis]MDE1674141.1 hypothetical protein [Nocardia gipuzkoensis]
MAALEISGNGAETFERLLDSAPRALSRPGFPINRRVRAALGPDADPAVVRILEDLYAGALIDAEVGYASHASGAGDAGSLVVRILRR